ncbi:MAG: murein biosynthesis integral membrane protein MurJ, partial [Deltaproteobacteria bacterium]|nr:murein biosynthesis integral membrane protein MurJ [Deltaproteobacteria bacterium]
MEKSSVSQNNSSGHSLARHASVVSVLTLLSRFFGLARDAVIAYVVGAKASADAFYVAFRIPNLFRRLLAEGNLTLSFVPVFTQKFQESKEEARTLASVTMTALMLFLTLLTLAGIVGASYFVQVTARGFSQYPEKFALTVSLTRITFPYLALVSLSALAMGILNARKHFAMPALAPVMLNLGIIVTTFLGNKFWDLPAIAIAWGVLVGGSLQLLIQIPPLIKRGLLPKLNFNFKNLNFLKVLKLMGPAVHGSAV